MTGKGAYTNTYTRKIGECVIQCHSVHWDITSPLQAPYPFQRFGERLKPQQKGPGFHTMTVSTIC